MRLEQVSNLEAVFGIVGLIAVAILIFRLVPRADDGAAPIRSRAADITRHDAALPKYFLVTALALSIGALHLAIRSIPAVAGWLAQGGYGGHLVRDIAYSHMVIVMGGTIAVTGLTWYALPRILRRPLYSDTLAQLAFWGTVVGAAGFYLSNVVTGSIMAAMENAGLSASQADYAVGLWRALSVGMSASIMGLGYWTYVTNVLLTVFTGTAADASQPMRHLAKFFVFGAIGLLIGTVQGVIQVMPESEAWLKMAGAAGAYIDPISHAHVNLVTGVLSLVAGLVFFITRGAQASAGQRRIEEVVFWTMVPGSLAFYATLLYLGFAEGTLAVEQGLAFSGAVRSMGLLHTVPLLASGGLTLFGVLMFIGVTAWRVWALRRLTIGAGAILAGVMILALGAMQGGIQTLPLVKAWMVASGPAGHAIANAHAQLNMLGGVLIILLGLMLAVGAPIVGGDVASGRVARTLPMLAGGALVYYAAALATALSAGLAIHQGRPTLDAMEQARSLGGIGMVVGALLYFAGAALLARFAWQSTALYRAHAWQTLSREIAHHNATAATWRRHIRKRQLLIPELIGALFGFPGLGWMLSGRTLIGLPLMFGGPFVAWAVFPSLLSPYGDARLPHIDPSTLQIYLLVSAAVSVGALWRTIVAVDSAPMLPAGSAGKPGLESGAKL